jgi:hypothetical protein
MLTYVTTQSEEKNKNPSAFCPNGKENSQHRRVNNQREREDDSKHDVENEYAEEKRCHKEKYMHKIEGQHNKADRSEKSNIRCHTRHEANHRERI